jgi:hypothetical protein
MAGRQWLGLLCLVGLLGPVAGCGAGVTIGSPGGLPRCRPPPGRVSGATVILAQSVPSAQWLPCVRALPPGWGFEMLDPHNGHATFWLSSDRDGTRAVGVLLRPTCDVSGATEIPSEQPGLRRYERVTRVTRGYGGERHYVFPGGCITYQFNLRGTTRAEPVAAVTEALGFLSRSRLDSQLRAASGGRLTLDDGSSP